ncbi:hypothetical protein OAE39_02750 [Akkermansiaceae bacterium]|nr:hypothetical protein [Akkermansiaceae bacterium]
MTKLAGTIGVVSVAGNLALTGYLLSERGDAETTKALGHSGSVEARDSGLADEVAAFETGGVYFLLSKESGGDQITLFKEF